LLVAGLVVLFGWVSAVARWVAWSAVVSWVATRAGLITLLVALGLLSAAGWSWIHRAHRDRRAGGAGPRPALSWWVVAVALLLVVVVSWGATSWLLQVAAHAKDVAAAQVDAIKTGLGIGAGTGGVFALLLAVRRQWHQELSAQDTVLDATERRVTELYTKAADQLGSDKAPVRLAGLYALERLAQANPTQRQTVVNVLCAYLRMPYQPSDPPPSDVGGTGPPTRRRGIVRPAARGVVRGAPLNKAAADRTTAVERERRVQEREVRLTAQRILAEHLLPGSDPDHPVATFWADSDLDLSGAALVDFDMHDCWSRIARFSGATFTGDVEFAGATFAGVGRFDGATFAGVARFDGATFAGDTTFDGATFTGDAWLAGATFTGDAWLAGATFVKGAWFAGATFTKGAWFARATFTSEAAFRKVVFTGDAVFAGAAFTGDAEFAGAAFTGNGGAGAALGAARFAGKPGLRQVLPPGLRWAPEDRSGWRTAVPAGSGTESGSSADDRVEPPLNSRPTG
jgi:uncharacterized protein YjbI with pentapeptide repeats